MPLAEINTLNKNYIIGTYYHGGNAFLAQVYHIEYITVEKIVLKTSRRRVKKSRVRTTAMKTRSQYLRVIIQPKNPASTVKTVNKYETIFTFNITVIIIILLPYIP